MNTSIKLALMALMKEETIVAAWGIHHISIEESSIKFDVQGFKFQGTVVIESDESRYSVMIGNNLFPQCAIQELVAILDEQIEKTDNYGETLEWWIFGE